MARQLELFPIDDELRRELPPIVIEGTHSIGDHTVYIAGPPRIVYHDGRRCPDPWNFPYK